MGILMAAQELDWCPFCENNQNIVHKSDGGEDYIRCEWCGCGWFILVNKNKPRITKKDLIDRYNTRPIESALKDRIKELIALVHDSTHSKNDEIQIRRIHAELTKIEKALKERP